MEQKKLNEYRQIQNLAHNLGYKFSSNPVKDILSYCDSALEAMMSQVPDCATLNDMLNWVANKVRTTFEIINSDDDLATIKNKYLQRREPGFYDLESLFVDEDDLGVTIKLLRAEEWEPQFVSVIDCRGKKAFRAYFTKWHEIAHIITTFRGADGSQVSHAAASSGKPIEQLMDIIAGRLGFHVTFTQQEITDKVSFEAIESLRQKLCPEASFQSALISFTKFWTSPCILVTAEMGYKMAEKAALQTGFLFEEFKPQPELRAVRVCCSDIARESGFIIHQNMQVPPESVVSKLFTGIGSYAEAVEDLSWWKSVTTGRKLPYFKIRVMARRSADAVNALICLA